MPGFVPNLLGKVDAQTNKVIAELYSRISTLESKVAKPGNPALIDYGKISRELSISGAHPLNIAGLIGELSQVQKSKAVPVVGNLPGPTNPLSQPGAIIQFNGLLYFFDTSTNPGIWKAVGAVGVVLSDTHANRVANFNPSSYPIGILFWETDRKSLYINLGSFGSSSWAFMVGLYIDILANRPSDLGANDVGFLFYASNFRITYIFSGSVWANKEEGIFEPNAKYITGSSYGILGTDFEISTVISNPCTITLPASASVPLQSFNIRNSLSSSANTTVNSLGGDLMETLSTLVLAPGEGIWLQSDTGTGWIIQGRTTIVTGGITQLTGDVTAGPGSGSQVATAVKIPPGVTLIGTPSTGQVPTATGTTTATWQTPSPSGDPAWTAYFPSITWSAGSVTVGSSDCASVQAGKTIKIRIHITFTLGTAGTTSDFLTIAMPATPVSDGQTMARSLFKTTFSSGGIETNGQFSGANFRVGAFSASLTTGVTYDLKINGVFETV